MPSKLIIQHACSFVLLLAAVCGASAINAAIAAAEGDVSHAVGEIKPKQLVEISGIEASREYPKTLWMHNDGDSELLFAISTSGNLVALVSFPAEVVDVEDMAIGPGLESGRDYLYLGDIGDNDLERREIRIVRFAEPELYGKRGEQIHVDDAEVFRVSYPDGSHNAEALFVDPRDGELFIVTKEGKRARLYTVPVRQLSEKGTARLKKVGDVDVDQVSAGAISADGSRILLRREGQGWLWHRDKGESVAAALERKPERVPVLGKRQGPNGESICFAPDGDSYFTVSEGKKQAVYEFDLPSAAEADDR